MLRAAFSRLLADRFILALFVTIALASIIPVRGAQVSYANLAASGAVFIIFFLHGLRLPRQEVINGLRDWRLQGVIFLLIFGAMPLIGWIFYRALLPFLPASIAVGLLFLGALPTTVQSATSYCALSKGRVIVSVVASALNNLAAIILSPLIFALLAGRVGGVTLSSTLAIKVALMLLLPFVIGQIMQPWLRHHAMRHPDLTRAFDQGAILIAVYVSYSAAVVGGLWHMLGPPAMMALFGALALFLALSFGGGWLLGKRLRLPLSDRIALLFSGAHKSIAVGAPLAALMFAPAQAGMVLLPVLLYHLGQLILSAILAPHLAATADAGNEVATNR